MTDHASATSPVGSGGRPEGALPLTQTTFYLLASLVDGPKHGYAISKDVEARSEGAVRLAVGNLYVALRRLAEQGLIERVADPMADDEGRKTHRITKTYQITDMGNAVFRAETERQRRMMAANPLLQRDGATR